MGSNLARGKIFTASIGSVDSPLMHYIPPYILYIYEQRHAIMCLQETNYVMRYDVVKSDVIISRRA